MHNPFVCVLMKYQRNLYQISKGVLISDKYTWSIKKIFLEYNFTFTEMYKSMFSVCFLSSEHLAKADIFQNHAISQTFILLELFTAINRKFYC